MSVVWNSYAWTIDGVLGIYPGSELVDSNSGKVLTPSDFNRSSWADLETDDVPWFRVYLRYPSGEVISFTAEGAKLREEIGKQEDKISDLEGQIWDLKRELEIERAFWWPDPGWGVPRWVRGAMALLILALLIKTCR